MTSASDSWFPTTSYMDLVNTGEVSATDTTALGDMAETLG